MGSRGGFRVVLDRKDWLSPVLQPLDGTVVEIDVSDLEVRSAGDLPFRSLNRESVVLRRDENPPAPDVLYGMIPAAMAVRHFRCFRAVRQRENLMSKADAENRHARLGD